MVAVQMPNKAAPGHKNSNTSQWHDIWLSPTPSWSSLAPSAVKLGDHEISPASSSSTLPSPLSRFSFGFATPKQSKQSSSFFTSPAKQYGYLVADRMPRGVRRKRHQIGTAVFLVLFWAWGIWSWSSLLELSRDPIPSNPPPGSQSAIAREAFANLYTRDWGAEPSLWVVLDASTSKRVEVLRDTRPDDTHSLTDETSMAYEEGNRFSQNLAKHLSEKFQNNVRVTDYYSLQDEGLHYLANQKVTPDGKLAIIQIQFIKGEIGGDPIKEIGKSIAAFSTEHEPLYLDVHYTGENWNPPRNSLFYCFAFLLGCVGLLLALFETRHQSFEWGLMIATSMATTLSGSATSILLQKIPPTPMTISTLVALSFVLSVYYSRFQMDSCIDEAKDLHATIAHSGGLLIALFATSFIFLPCPALHSISAAAMATVGSSVSFYIFLAPHVLGTSPGKHINTPRTNQKPRPRSMIAFCVTSPFVLFVAYQARRFNVSLAEAVLVDPVGSAPPSHLQMMGESMGHGRLTPYRVLFDGHGRKQPMVSLNGYDVIQMVVDELRGISLSDTSYGDADEDSSEPGSTHVGESFQEVQHLIKDVVHHLKQLREEQQRELDFYHHRRQAQWEQQREQQESDFEDVRCEFNVNKETTFSGIAVLENLRIPQSLYNAANICREMKPRCPSEALHLLNVLEDETTTSDLMATFVTVNLGVDPFSKDGKNWLSLARESLRRLQEDPRILGGVQVHIGGPAADYHDSQKAFTEGLSLQLAIVAIVTLLTVALSVGRILVPLKIFATFGANLAVSVGAGVLIYKDGILDWARIPALASFDGAEHSFELPTVCLLAAGITLISEISSNTRQQRGMMRNQKALVASTKLVGLCLALWVFCFGRSREHLDRWPVLVATSMFVDMLWLRMIVLPGMTTILPFFSMKESASQVKGQRLCMTDDSDPERKNGDYLEKFDELLRSPQAP